jgi:hypothetical protein
MQRMRWWAGFAMLAGCLLQAVAIAEDKVEVKVAKYTDLTTRIKELKGKVIVTDFWADW